MVGQVRCLVRLVKGKFVAKVRMGRELGGVAPRFRPQRLELTHFVTSSVMFFVVFHAFRNLYTPPKTPFFPTGPASLLVVIRGFPPHIIDTRA